MHQLEQNIKSNKKEITNTNLDLEKNKQTFQDNFKKIQQSEQQLGDKQSRLELLKKQEHEMSEQISKEQQKQSDLGFKQNQLNSI